MPVSADISGSRATLVADISGATKSTAKALTLGMAGEEQLARIVRRLEAGMKEGERGCTHAEAGACSFCYESAQATIRELVGAVRSAAKWLDQEPGNRLRVKHLYELADKATKEGRP
jgi:hypothetical protein